MKNKKILIVEDEPDIRELTALMLTGVGFETVAVESCTRALRLIEEAREGKPFDAVILDCALEVMDGIECAQQIRLNEQGRESAPLRIAFYTAFDRSHAFHGLLNGVNAERCFQKGADTQQLPTLVKEWLCA